MIERVHRGLAGAVAAGLIGVALGAAPPLTPARAGGDDATGAALIGGFALGDGLEGTIDERVGAFHFELPVGGLGLVWDSRQVADDRYRLGAGWGWGLSRVETVGGIQVFPPSGGAFAPDATHPSGLAGYGVHDVVFEHAPGTLPGRAIEGPAVPTSVEYEFLLRELGGVVTYFGPAGDPVAQIDRFGARNDWVWHESGDHRLTGTIDPDGMVTLVDWDSDPSAVLVRPAANADAARGRSGSIWRLELDGGRVGAVTDAFGDRVPFEANRTGLVTAISGVSGGVTRVDWLTHADGVARVSSVRTTDATGLALSRRTWAPGSDGALPTGWPRHAGEAEVFWASDPGYRYRTALGDGATRVVSEYSSQHLLVERHTVATSPTGEHVVHEQVFAYPGTEHGGLPDPSALPGNWSRPAEATVTLREPAGRARTATGTFRFDERGRLIERTDHDGTTTVTEYDETAPVGSTLPIGLPVAETTTAPDGLVEISRHTLNPGRTAPVVTETLQGDSVATAVVTARSELDVRADGFVSSRREVPVADPHVPPVSTVWDRTVDLARGEATTTETIAAGTPSQASTSETTSLVHGGVLVSVDALGNTARTRYDAIGRPVEVTDARGRVTSTEHETAQRHGRNAVTVTGPDGVAHTEIRDELGRVIRTTDTIDRGIAVPGFTRVVETRAYPEPGVVAVTDAWGRTTTTRQDLFGRVVEVAAPSGLAQVTEYDDVRNTVTTALTPTGRVADAELVRTEHLDPRGRAITVDRRRADGADTPTELTEYDGLDRVTATSNGTLDTRIDHDELGRPVTVAFGDLVATRSFDGFGRSVEKIIAGDTDGRSGGRRAHDELGRTAGETDQTDRATVYEHTVDGLVAAANTADGARTEHTYDPVTRLPLTTTMTAPGRDPVRIGYAYDSMTDELTGIFDPADPAGTTITSRYDAFGNRTSVEYPDGATITSAYDHHGRRIGTTDVAGVSTRFAHTADGLLERATQHGADGELLAEVGYEYDEYRRMTSLTRGNGLVTRFSFTAASEIASETTTDASGRIRSHRAYTYDPRGNLVRRTDMVGPLASGERDQRSTTTVYDYDVHDRLVRSAVQDGADGPGHETTYGLSAAGDVLAETTTTSPGTAAERIASHSYDYGPRGELRARTSTESSPGGRLTVRQEQTWDAAGNLLRGIDGTRFVYDAADRPVREVGPDGRAVSIRYWADGTRRDRTTTRPDGPAETTGFYWDGSDLLNETHAGAHAGANGTAAYLLGLSRHTRTTLVEGRADPSYYGTDRHGNVTDTTDAAGRTTRRSTYTDYGVEARRDGAESDGGSGLLRDPFGYAGEYTDATGRQHLRERTYDPFTLQFTTRDAALRHNRYAYADLNPITNVDPTGRASAPDGWHPAMIGLGLAFSTMMLVMGMAAPPLASLGAFGIGLTVAGTLANAYAVAVSVGSLLVAADRSRSNVDEGARRFFESEGVWVAEVSMSLSLPATYLLATAALPRLASWFRATFTPPKNLLALEMSTVTELPPPSGATLLTQWRRMARDSQTHPLSALAAHLDELLRRTVVGLRHDALALVANRRALVRSSPGSIGPTATPLLDHGRPIGGFRAWLFAQGIPMELSAEIYAAAGLPAGLAGRRALARKIQPHVAKVLTTRQQALDTMPFHCESEGLRVARLQDLETRLGVLAEPPASGAY